MGVGLLRSLQTPDILLIHWRVYKSTANISKGALFLPPSDVYGKSFLYLLNILIKLYYTKGLSHQASGPGLNSSPPETKNPGVFSWFSNNLSLVIKKLPVNAGDMRHGFDPWVRKSPLRRGLHSSILTWRIPWIGEPCRLQSIESHRIKHD